MSGLFNIRRLTALAILLVGFYVLKTGEYYSQELLAEIAILAIFAMSLDVLVGYAGMVSLGHAVFLGLGSYVTAIFTVQQGWGVFPAMMLSVVVTGVAAALIGLIVVRLGGIFFIMITLAISQMFHAYFLKNREYGGDDGMPGVPRIDLEAFGLNTFDPADFALFVVVMAAIIFILLDLMMSSPFGRYLVGIHQNENRMRALGTPVNLYKLAAFILAGMIAGFAGALKAQHTGFVSPDTMYWTVSGIALIMVIVGGGGSLVGAALGAIIIHLMSDEISSLTEYWKFYMGIFFICVVLFAGDGVFGTVVKKLEAYKRRKLMPKEEGGG